MIRKDEGLAFLLQYENVAWYENGSVRILDRRIYPTQINYVVCKSYQEVIKAVSDMVTQSAGPYTAMGMGMALAAYEAKSLPKSEMLEYLNTAALQLSQARPTTANRYYQITTKCVDVAKKAIGEDRDIVKAIVDDTIESLNRRYMIMEKIATYFIEQIDDNATILTQCFGETIIGMICRVAQKNNRKIKFYHAETRPYLQGARLSASVCHEMGFDSTVITDNMVAYVMSTKHIDVFTSAADTIAMDGTIANKIGTLQIAILCNYYNIPYYVTGIPDQDKKSVNDIIIEQRDPKQILQINGVGHVIDGVKGLYPAFDITPAYLISGIVTDHGLFKACELGEYSKKEKMVFY